MSKATASLRGHRLRSLSVTGGFLDGLELQFDAGLNCFIGPRGTGKTTILEFVRYALEQLPSDSAARKRIESLVQYNLKGGCIRLTIETKDGLTYIISRTADDDAIVMDSKGHATDITLGTSGLFKANIFSQNEVEGIADNPADQLRLLDSFDQDVLRDIESKIKQHQRSLATNAHDCLDLQKRMAGLEDELNTLPGVETKLEELSAAAGGDAAEVNQAQNKKALRDRERRALETLSLNLRSLANDISLIHGKFEQRLATAFTRDILDGPNGESLRTLSQKLLGSAKTVERLIQDARLNTEESQRLVEDAQSKITSSHRVQELEFQNLLTKHKEVQVQSSERANLEKVRNDLLTKSRAFEENAEKFKRLQQKRDEMLRELASLRNQRFEHRRKVAERINEDVLPHIRVKVEQFGNNDLYQELLERSLKGAGIQHNKVAQKITARIAPSDFVAIVRSGNVESMTTRADLSADQSKKVIGAVSESGLLYEIETVELPDLPCIELLDGGEYKNSLTLSTGQKCTSILPILLLDSVSPLLIDQPEDNLDNRFIYTTVVKRLRAVKSGRQLVFITHNPNIPVLGDADQVIVLKSTGTLSAKQKEGTVDECKQEIVTILEGGAEAFKERRKRYAF